MAIRSNSKTARAGVVDYIRNYTEDDLQEAGLLGCSDAVMLAYIRDQFTREACYENNMRRCGWSLYTVFKDWARGLPLGQLFVYMLRRSAVDDLGAILHETDAEKAKYTEEQAEEMLTRLIFRAVQEGR